MLVFQYGSNASERRLNADERMRGDARLVGAFQTVATYELGFTVWSNGNSCAAANIAPGAGPRIWGAVYEIPDYLMSRDTAGKRRSMDAIEGNRYRRETIALLDPSGRLEGKPVVTYVVKEPVMGLKTSLDYAAHILYGLWSLGAPEDYVAYVTGRILANNSDLASGVAAL
jgi:gamma-glutamylcyclotransferase (GGCT)/AIG2-like uncharacterized protein YtfP